MDLRTVRLAIVCGDRSDKALYPSQVAQSTIHLRTEGNAASLEGSFIWRRLPGKGRVGEIDGEGC
jgi:hypothetical protein